MTADDVFMEIRAGLAYTAYGLPVPAHAPIRDWGDLDRTVPGEPILPDENGHAMCGTEAGYNRHRRTIGEPPCDACREARNAVDRVRGRKRRAA